jgi:hypothetical protein
MGISRICSCLLLLATLLGISSCSGSTYVKKGPETKTNTVKISSCKANPDTAQVPRNDNLTWIIDPPDGHTYSVVFPKSTPFSLSTIQTGQAQRVNGTFLCNALGAISTGLCVYPYNLLQNDTKIICPDPGVHVVPSS